jgi:hypothetical protein
LKLIFWNRDVNKNHWFTFGRCRSYWLPIEIGDEYNYIMPSKTVSKKTYFHSLFLASMWVQLGFFGGVRVAHLFSFPWIFILLVFVLCLALNVACVPSWPLPPPLFRSSLTFFVFRIKTIIYAYVIMSK